MKTKIQIQQDSENYFKQGLSIGFIISFGLIFFVHPLAGSSWEVIFQLTIGTGFMGIVFNLLMMGFTSLLLMIFPQTFAFRFKRDELFNLIIRSHVPLFFGVAIAISKIFNFEISQIIFFSILEILSIALLFSKFREAKII